MKRMMAVALIFSMLINMFMLVFVLNSGNPQSYLVASDRAITEDATYAPFRLVTETAMVVIEDVRVSEMVRNISPSVVAIVGTTQGTALAHQDRWATRMVGGSGVVIRSGGDILTNAHVVENMETIAVVLHDGSVYNGTVRFIDEASDLAVVRIPRLGLPIVTFANDEEIIPGETVIAIGTPLSFSLRNTVTKGIISGIDRGLSGEYALIQTDAAINSGNSGGPLVNLNGQVVGINSSKFAGFGIEGIGFSIPAGTVRFVLDQFDRYGEVRRPNINATLEEGWAARRGLPTREGLRVVATAGLAQQEGLRAEDVILAVDGRLVHSLVDFNELMIQYNRGARPSFTVRRAAETISVNLTLQ